MRTLYKVLIAGAFAAVVALALFDRDADASTADAPQAPPAVVSVAAAVEVEIAPVHWAPGDVVSRRDARVAGDQPGRVSRIAEVGDHVAAGAPLAVLDDTALHLRERELEADTARIRAQLGIARRQERRHAQLAETQGIARAQHDQLRADAEMLAADHDRVLAQLAQARHQRARMIVRAPFDGIVAERAVQPGEYLAQGGAVARLVDPDAWEVRVRAPLGLAAHLAPGTPVEVRRGGDLHAFTVSALVPIGDESSRQLELRVAGVGRPWPVGTAVDVALPSGNRRTVIAVSRDALVLRPDGEFVLRVDDRGGTERLAVERGAEVDGLVEVAGDVAAGDRLVVRGGERLAPGQRVTVATATAQPAAGRASTSAPAAAPASAAG